MVHGLYQAVVDEPLPKTMLELVTQVLQKHPSPDAERARRWHAKAQEVRTAAKSMAASRLAIRSCDLRKSTTP